MSLYGALFSGVSGLTANSNAMGMISDNITNVNTVGYKGTTAQFRTLVAETSGSNYAPGGVQAVSRALIDKPGLLQSSNSATDLSVDGSGFFVVKKTVSGDAVNGEIQFTRAGSYTPDENGLLRNTAGLYLMGWPIDSSGEIPTNLSNLSNLTFINTAGLTGTAESTSSVALRANLQASQAVSPLEATYSASTSANNMASGAVSSDFTYDVQVYDALGGVRTLTLSFLKSAAPNQWHVEIFASPANDVTAGAGLVNGQVAAGTLAFNDNGSLNIAATSPALVSSFPVNWSGGAAPSSIAIDFGSDGLTDGFTQFNSISNVQSSSTNGAIFGNVVGVAIGNDGVVTALFDNGLTKDVYMLPVATFQNPNGLSRRTGNAYVMSDDSGSFALQRPGTGGAGAIVPKSLEASNIDIGGEFVKLITTQRAFSASTKIITTADEMLDELNRTKR